MISSEEHFQWFCYIRTLGLLLISQKAIIYCQILWIDSIFCCPPSLFSFLATNSGHKQSTKNRGPMQSEAARRIFETQRCRRYSNRRYASDKRENDTAGNSREVAAAHSCHAILEGHNWTKANRFPIEIHFGQKLNSLNHTHTSTCTQITKGNLSPSIESLSVKIRLNAGGDHMSSTCNCFWE